MWKSIRLDKYLGYKSSLKAYLWIDNMISNNDLGLNLYVVLTTCFMVIILN